MTHISSTYFFCTPFSLLCFFPKFSHLVIFSEERKNIEGIGLEESTHHPKLSFSPHDCCIQWGCLCLSLEACFLLDNSPAIPDFRHQGTLPPSSKNSAFDKNSPIIALMYLSLSLYFCWYLFFFVLGPDILVITSPREQGKTGQSIKIKD